MIGRQVVPEGLALMAPGPELAAVLAGIDVARVSGSDVVTVMRAWHRQKAHTEGMFQLAVVESGLRSDPGFGREPVKAEFRPSEARAALVLTRRGAERLYWSSEDLITRLPLVHAAMLDGCIDGLRAEVLRDWTQNLSPEQARSICTVLLPVAASLTPGQLADRVRTMALAIDPAWAKRDYDDAVADRNVVAERNPDGSANVEARNLPLEQAAATSATLSRLARAARRAGDPRTLDQLRADLFGVMTDGTALGMGEKEVLAHVLAHPPGPPTPPEPVRCQEVHVRGRLSTLLGADDRPGELAGWGPIPAGHLRDLLPKLGTAQWRFAIADPDGHLLHTGLITSRPNGISTRSGAHGILEITVRESDLDILDDPAQRGGWNRVLRELREHHHEWQKQQQEQQQHPENAEAAEAAEAGRRMPGAGLRRYLHARDRHCFFPGCRAPASNAQIDHTIRWTDEGRTVEPNLGAGCAHHHRLKDDGGWTVIQASTGTFDWTSRLGHHYHRHHERIIDDDLPDPQNRSLPTEYPIVECDRDPEHMLTESRPSPEPVIHHEPEPDQEDDEPPF